MEDGEVPPLVPLGDGAVTSEQVSESIRQSRHAIRQVYTISRGAWDRANHAVSLAEQALDRLDLIAGKVGEEKFDEGGLLGRIAKSIVENHASLVRMDKRSNTMLKWIQGGISIVIALVSIGVAITALGGPHK